MQFCETKPISMLIMIPLLGSIGGSLMPGAAFAAIFCGYTSPDQECFLLALGDPATSLRAIHPQATAATRTRAPLK
jgi:hypothetical protein